MSISQAGVYSLKLYENKDFYFEYNDSDLILLSSISNTGDIIELETNDNFIKYDNKLVPAENNTTLNDHTLTFQINGLLQSNLDIIEKLQSSIYGWIALITFMDTQVYLINIPFHPKVDKFDSQATHTFFIEIKPRIFTFEKLQEVDITPIITIPVPNAGAEGTDDWINPTAGLADLWNITDLGAENVVPTIATGDGFAGNSQKIDMPNGGCIFESDLFGVVQGNTYILKFQFRNSMDPILTNIRIIQEDATIIDLGVLPSNSADAINYESSQFVINDDNAKVYLSFLNSVIVRFVQFNEIKLVEQ